MKQATVRGIPVEVVALADLKPHPRNYRTHPPDQLAHIIKSIEEHGVYRNVVVAQDYTILAGHGVCKALAQMGRDQVPVLRLPIAPDSPQALKVLAGDNEIGHLAQVDDRLFTEILKEVKELDSLLGTGFDEMMLANLVYVTRPEGEIGDRDQAAEWAGAGMPDYADGGIPFKLTISFRTKEDRLRFIAEHGLRVRTQGETALCWMTWWPYREQEDTSAVRFEQATEPMPPAVMASSDRGQTAAQKAPVETTA